MVEKQPTEVVAADVFEFLADQHGRQEGGPDFRRRVGTVRPHDRPPGRPGFQGMIEVLSDGPAEFQTQAGLVLSRNGVSVSSSGDEASPDWVLTLANGETLTVTPHHRSEADSDSNPWGEPPPTLDAAAMRKLLRAYAVMFAIAALAIGAYATDGALQVILAVIACVIFAVALWSTLFMIVARIFQKGDQRAFPDA